MKESQMTRYEDNPRYERIYEYIVRPDDPRSPAKHDRDRILHSEALRRLANVTQVVDPAEGHVFHNRLTHTLKVAQIARRLAEKLILEQSDIASALELDPDIVEAAALAHDLGHPPFGHIAEKELDHLVYRNGELSDGYEGNPQSFRILTKLEVGSEANRGLNLTRATLNAVLKYPRMRQGLGEGGQKWGAYWTEKSEFDWVRNHRSINELRSVEAELMDWADDIAFSVHDVEDFYRAGLIPPVIFSDKPPMEEIEPYLKEVVSRYKAGDGTTRPSLNELKQDFQVFRLLLPFASPFKTTRKALTNLKNATSSLIDRYVNGISLNPAALKDPSIRTVEIDPELRKEIRFLKSLTWQYVIHNRALATQQFGKQRVITDLFNIIFEALTSGDKDQTFILPQDFESELESIEQDLREENQQLKRKQASARFAADMISSLTDNEAIRLHKRLSGFDSGSVLDRMPR